MVESPVVEEDDLAWLGPLPEEPPEAEAQRLRDEAAEAHFAWLSTLPAEVQFEKATGLRATAANGFDRADYPAPSLEDLAVVAQDAVVSLEHARRRADAARTVALVESFEASMADLAERYGPAFGLRTGLGAQTWFKSTGLQLGMHPFSLAHLVDTALMARDRLPLTWRVYRDGLTTWRALDTAVNQAIGLDPEYWAAYDERAARLVPSSTRLKDALRRVRERLQDNTAVQRAKTAAVSRSVRFEALPDGQAALTLTGPAVGLTAIEQTLTRAAVASHGDVDPEGRTVGQLRYDIALDLITAGFAATAGDGARVAQRKPVEVQLSVTIPMLSILGKTVEQATLAGYGPIDLDQARQLAGTAKSFVRILTDPVTGVRLTMDRTTYTPPADLRRWVITRDVTCRWPGCTRPAHLCDLDHAEAWDDGGVTDADNLIALCRRDHNRKTARLIEETLLPDGAVATTDPWRHRFTDPPAEPADPAPDDLLPPPDDDCPF